MRLTATRAALAALTALSLAMTTVPPAAADGFHDSDYHEVVLFEWDRAQLDVFINPPATGDPLGRTAALEASVDAWKAGIAALAPTWLASGLVINDFVVGRDIIPTASAKPEIIITSAEPGVLGIGISTDYIGGDWLCGNSRDASLGPAHQHEGSDWVVQVLSCRGVPNTCFVVNTNWMLYQNGMYDLNSHELGHCLGIGHVGDALDFHATTYPANDIMSYEHNPSQVHCVSNLNVLALQVAFADVFGATPPPVEYPSFDPYDPYVRMKPADYVQHACSNPPPSSLSGALAQDDAGSDRDAPNGPSPDVVVVPNKRYTGLIAGVAGDGEDWYAFQGLAGQQVHLRTTASHTFLCQWTVRDATGAALSSTCSLGILGDYHYRATLPASGTYYLRMSDLLGVPGAYGFAFALGSTAPHPVI